MKKSLLSIVFLTIGLVLVFHPTLFSGFSRIQTDLGDTRMINYDLEHTYRWLLQKSGHDDFWSPPRFYPVKNTTAYADILISIAPPYWIFRAIGFQLDTAFQLWSITLAILNFLAGLLFFRRGLHLSRFAANAGAFLLAFGSPRAAQLGHYQLLGCFFTVLSLYAILRLFQKNGKSTLHVFLFFMGYTAQMYSSFYMGWFYSVALLFAMPIILIFSHYRRTLFYILKTNVLSLLVCGSVSALLLLKLASVYLGIADVVGYRNFKEVSLMIPSLQTWLYMGSDSWLYGWQDSIRAFQIIAMKHEQRLGIGLVSTILSFIGFYRYRHKKTVQIFFLIAVLIFLAITNFPIHFTAWRYFYEWLPAAKAIRAVSRIGVFLLIPASIGFALYFQQAQASEKPKRIYLLILCFFCLLEQGQTTSSFNKETNRTVIQTLAKQISLDCRSFIYTPVNSDELHLWIYNLDAMWAQIVTGIPTVNGYTGQFPPHWPVDQIRNTNDEERINQLLSEWKKTHSLAEQDICWIKIPGQNR